MRSCALCSSSTLTTGAERSRRSSLPSEGSYAATAARSSAWASTSRRRCSSVRSTSGRGVDSVDTTVSVKGPPGLLFDDATTPNSDRKTDDETDSPTRRRVGDWRLRPDVHMAGPRATDERAPGRTVIGIGNVRPSLVPIGLMLRRTNDTENDRQTSGVGRRRSRRSAGFCPAFGAAAIAVGMAFGWLTARASECSFSLRLS